MRKSFYSFIFLSLMSLLFCVGCEKMDNLNSLPPVDYVCRLVVTDNQGNDIVKTLVKSYELDHENGDICQVSKLDYKFKELANPLAEERTSLIVDGSSEPWNLQIAFTMFFTDNPTFYTYKQTKCKLNCPLLFGDEKDHAIVINWKPRESYKSNPPWKSECLGFELDGKTYELKDGVVRLQLNR